MVSDFSHFHLTKRINEEILSVEKEYGNDAIPYVTYLSNFPCLSLLSKPFSHLVNKICSDFPGRAVL